MQVAHSHFCYCKFNNIKGHLQFGRLTPGEGGTETGGTETGGLIGGGGPGGRNPIKAEKVLLQQYRELFQFILNLSTALSVQIIYKKTYWKYLFTWR